MVTQDSGAAVTSFMLSPTTGQMLKATVLLKVVIWPVWTACKLTFKSHFDELKSHTNEKLKIHLQTTAKDIIA